MVDAKPMMILIPGDVWRDPDGVQWTVHPHHCPLDQCAYLVELHAGGMIIWPSELHPNSTLVGRAPTPRTAEQRNTSR